MLVLLVLTKHFETLGDDEPLSSEGIQSLMEVNRTIEEQLAELDHLRYLAKQQRRWISGLVGEFTACGQSSHLLT
jgi:hypothetical protein